MKRYPAVTILYVAVMLVSAVASHAENELDMGFASGSCQSIRYNQASYSVCSFEPAQHFVRLYHTSSQGQIYGRFKTLAEDLNRHGATLLFAMNGGMYHSTREPVGLYVENGKEISALNTNEGPGNFHLMPNGVFYVKDGQGGVLESQAYSKAKLNVDYATQSGPMLVIDGELHPRLLPDGTSKKKRNGVGVHANGTVRFLLSEEPVNFYSFASVFRDILDIQNALFLDGTVSKIYHKDSMRHDTGRFMGPIIGVTANQPQ